MLAALTAFAITSAARLLTGFSALGLLPLAWGLWQLDLGWAIAGFCRIFRWWPWRRIMPLVTMGNHAHRPAAGTAVAPDDPAPHGRKPVGCGRRRPTRPKRPSANPA